MGSGAAAALVMGGSALNLALTIAPAFALDGTAPAKAPGAQFDPAQLMKMAADLQDHPMGATDTKIMLIEYLSPTCSHCAAFHTNVLPQLKTEYIDTNKIMFLPRPFTRNILDAVVFMLAEAAGPERYHDVITTYFKTQQDWGTSDKPNDALFAIAQQLGFTKETYDAALTNQTLFTALEKVRDQAMNDFKLQGTPTFYLNGKMLSGEVTFDVFKAELDPLIG
jgi:protein-disulfide isomerase